MRVSGVLHTHVPRFRGGLVLRLIDLMYHSTLGLRVIKKREEHLMFGE